MATILKAYSDPAAARKAIDALYATGLPEGDVRLLIGSRAHDLRNEPVGGFAGTVARDAPVGSFGNLPHVGGHGTGTFAGDADRQRQGSFADTERDLIVHYQDGIERARVVGHATLRSELRQAGFDLNRVGHVLATLKQGRSAVIARVAEITPRDAAAALEHLALAA